MENFLHFLLQNGHHYHHDPIFAWEFSLFLFYIRYLYVYVCSLHHLISHLFFPLCKLSRSLEESRVGRSKRGKYSIRDSFPGPLPRFHFLLSFNMRAYFFIKANRQSRSQVRTKSFASCSIASFLLDYYFVGLLGNLLDGKERKRGNICMPLVHRKMIMMMALRKRRSVYDMSVFCISCQ